MHRLVEKRKLFLGGIVIPSKLGTLGHSDGDPVLHAIIDAFLGTWNVIGGELARGTHVDDYWPQNGQGLERLGYGIEKEFRAYNGGCH